MHGWSEDKLVSQLGTHEINTLHDADHTEKLRIAQLSGVKVDADTARQHRNEGNTDAEELKIMDSLVQRSKCKNLVR